jgi:hypothetical protein
MHWAITSQKEQWTDNGGIEANSGKDRSVRSSCTVFWLIVPFLLSGLRPLSSLFEAAKVALEMNRFLTGHSFPLIELGSTTSQPIEIYSIKRG